MWFAASDDDYGYSAGQPIEVRLIPGVTSKAITLAITDDDLLESAETFSISLGLPLPHLTNRGVLPGNVTTALVTIADNDGNLSHVRTLVQVHLFVLETIVSLSSDAYTVNETSGEVSILVTSSNISSTTFVVELHSIQHSATGKVTLHLLYALVFL